MNRSSTQIAAVQFWLVPKSQKSSSLLLCACRQWLNPPFPPRFRRRLLRNCGSNSRKSLEHHPWTTAAAPSSTNSFRSSVGSKPQKVSSQPRKTPFMQPIGMRCVTGTSCRFFGCLRPSEHRRSYQQHQCSSVSFSSSPAAATTAISSQPKPATTLNTIDDDINDNRNDTVQALLDEVGMERGFLDRLALQRPTPLRLKDMYQYGTATDPAQRLRNAQFLHKELPVRIAQRAVDLLTLPHGLSNAVPIRQVARIYLQFLRHFNEFPYPNNVEQEERFTDMLQSFVLDRTSVPVSIAQGVTAWFRKEGSIISSTTTSYSSNTIAPSKAVASTAVAAAAADKERLNEMENALYRFFTARVGLRFLTEHFVLCSKRKSDYSILVGTTGMPTTTTTTNENKNSNDNKNAKGKGESSTLSTNKTIRGCIDANVDVVKEIRNVADLVTLQTKDYYHGLCPEIDIVDCVSLHEFTYVPHHLHYMISELLKNSCRASVRRYKEFRAAGHDDFEVPAIRVIVVKGAEDVTIKVADRGGGIPRSLMATIWKFAHSTAHEDEQQTEFGSDTESGARIRGFGLPLARIYARYFGGELTLKSTEGYGLDAYLHLPQLGDSCEVLPLRVRDSPGARDSTPLVRPTAPTSTGAPRGHRTFTTNRASQINVVAPNVYPTNGKIQDYPLAL